MSDWASRMAMQLLSRMSTSDVTLDQRDYIAAALREARAMGPEWQYISTAPLMKTIMLFAIIDAKTGNWKMGTGWWREGYQSAEGCWIWEGREVEEYETQPTHWQPLPAAPKES